MNRYSWAPRNSRSESIRSAVAQYPGRTAHWLARVVYGTYRPAWGLVYAAFGRAVRNGYVDCAVGARKTTVYYPKEV